MRAFTFDPDKHIYRWADTGEEIPSVTQVIKRAGLSNMDGIPAEVLRIAGERGTNVHLATALHDYGTLDTIDPAHVPYLDAWKMWLEVFKVSFEPNEIELQLVSEKYNFAGGLDRFKVRDNKLLVPDIKSGSKVYKTTGIQLGGYEILLKENFPELEKYPCERVAVQLKKNGKFQCHHFNEDYYPARFLKCLSGNLTPEEIESWKV